VKRKPLGGRNQSPQHLQANLRLRYFTDCSLLKRRCLFADDEIPQSQLR
jgi:hypothetical protein